MRDRMLAGEQSQDIDPQARAERKQCQLVLAGYNASSPQDEAGRRRILEELFASFGAGSVIERGLMCDYGFQVHIGTNSFINYDAILLDVATITIGNDVAIGPRAQLLTALHPMADHQARLDKWESSAPITIGDNVWLGGGVIVCGGVTIGDNTVIGAGSVVTRDVPSRVFAAGNPARVIREL